MSAWARALCLFACLLPGAGLLLGPLQARAAPPQAPAGYSAADLYNLANSYARAGKPGMAVLNYERAGLLVPDDPDVAANLQFVRASAHLPPATRSTFDRIAGIASPSVLSWLGIVGLTMAGACMLLGRSTARYRRLRHAGVLLGLCMVSLTVCNGIALWPRLHSGVVIVAATPVRVSPVPMGDALFTLAEGETVKLAAQHEGYTLILTRAGRSGWVSNANVAPIVPRR
ncbi:MAG TPA: SH3 domain-containing protein [Steroidobacteraceae bacterium]|jgi:hypothetical protein|nr:SH3 domain-containing protein [Steroidobacteraceae bacterium]